tara:strand:+ start:4091 stop:4585 length:495 start_codon:yes stop_codon:yes gene_type:complete
MAILRAGPFASSTDSFLGEPVTPNRIILPVNCAMNDWVNGSWRAAKRILYFIGTEPDDETVTYEDGPTLEASFVGTPGAFFSAAAIEFRYQAAEDTTFTVTYSASGPNPQLSIVVGGSSVFTNRGTSSISGTETITLPAATVPSAVNVNITTEGVGTGSISIAP